MLMCMKQHIVVVDSKGVNVDGPGLLQKLLEKHVTQLPFLTLP